MLVRDARDSDLPAMRRIVAASPEAGAWEALDWTPPRRCLVACLDAEPAGFLLASCPIGDEAEILTLAVDPACRRRGVGGALLGAFLGGRRGRVFLEVRPSNLAARGLYGSFGFSERGRRSGYYTSPREDAILLERTLPIIWPII